MSRLGSWVPQTMEERMDRMESLAAIRQLPHRYGVAIDSRDMDMMVSLFAPDVRVGKGQSGRAALRAWYTKTMSTAGPSVHFIGNHVVDFDDADHAHGIVYCRDELDHPQDGEWVVGMLQYWDDYERIDGEWCFRRRKFHRLYINDALVRPQPGNGIEEGQSALTTYRLPDAYPSWARYWAEVAALEATAES